MFLGDFIAKVLEKTVVHDEYGAQQAGVIQFGMT
jgi:hypothetical protein